MLKDRKSSIFILGALVITAILYWPALNFDFAWLDQSEILEGRLIGRSWSEMLSFFFGNDLNTPAYHRPLYNAMHSLDVLIWGNNPQGFHLSSIIIHLCNGLLLFTLIKRYLNDKVLSVLIVLAWLILPLNAASVALIHSKADLLFLFFILLAANVYKGKIGGKWASGLSSILLLMSLLSKETALAFPLGLAVLHFLDIHKLKKNEWILLGMPVVVFVLMRVFTTSVETAFVDNYFHRLISFPMVYGSYFIESIPGFRLTISDTVYAPPAQTLLSNVYQYGIFALSILAQFVIWRKYKKARPFIVMYNVFLIPVSQILPINHFRADRFLYASSIAWVGMMFIVIKDLVSKYANVSNGILLGLCTVWGILLFSYLPSFNNNDTLFGRTLDLVPDNREALSFLGKGYLEKKDFKSAEFFLRRALNNNPMIFSFVDRKSSQGNLGNILMGKGDYEGALSMFEEINKTYSTLPGLNLNMGVCYKNLGKPEKALEFLSLHQKDFPDDLLGMEKIAEVYIDLGYKERAITEFNKILRLYPDHEHAVSIKNAIENLHRMI